ncbi:MAG TPA: NHL repeat-containing protein, partial [Anaerolineaceae bacterium]|nr:NHL repeat-containing protein [Anaerolineaceae bacterium]
TNPPFQGNSIEKLQATANFIFALAGVLASGAGLAILLKSWKTNQIWRLLGIGFLAILAVQTARTAVRVNFINYDKATEFLVYAHAARGPKDILAQVEEISKRTTGGLDIAVAYDSDSQYPYWWYFRRYPKKIFFAGNPTRELRNDPIVIAGEANFEKVDNILKDAFYKYEYTRLWWPMQGYFGLDNNDPQKGELGWQRIWNAISTPAVRAAIFDIWANDDFTQYAKVFNDPNLTLTTWRPADRIRMYIRKDIVAQIWNYGVAPAPEAVPPDPYEKGRIQITADRIIGGEKGNQPGQFDAPRGIAVAKDGSLYVADSHNNRIQHLAADGTVLQIWGTFADISKGDAPGGTFFEPWGVAVGPDGSVYVTDTWNSRVEKFTAEGKFIKLWGYFGQAEKPEAFWGPRGILVDSQNRVFITDTGNKRIVIFDSEGGYINSFGGEGADPGQFSEPVGIAMDAQGNLFVADTWNQRMQVFTPDASGKNFVPSLQWDITGWNGQSVENKPFVAVDPAGHVYVTDPEGARVLEFNQSGQFLQTWGDPGSADNAFGLALAVAVDPEGGVWVTDSANNRLMHFIVPPK